MSTSSTSTIDVSVDPNQPKQFQQFCRRHERSLMVLGGLLVMCLYIAILIATKAGPLSSRWLGVSASLSFIGGTLLTALMAAKRTPRTFRRRMMLVCPPVALIVVFMLCALW